MNDEKDHHTRRLPVARAVLYGTFELEDVIAEHGGVPVNLARRAQPTFGLRLLHPRVRGGFHGYRQCDFEFLARCGGNVAHLTHDWMREKTLFSFVLSTEFPKAVDSPVLERNRARLRWKGTTMKHSILMMAAWLCVATAAGADFYVATDGNDDHPGTEAQPFATLRRARDAVRQWRAAAEAGGPVTVHLRGGVYELTETLALAAEDSGTKDAPVVWRNHASERVALSGGRRIGGFKPVTDQDVLQRLPETARGKVLQADVRAAGITDFGEVAADGKRIELFCNDRPMTLARWPNASGRSTRPRARSNWSRRITASATGKASGAERGSGKGGKSHFVGSLGRSLFLSRSPLGGAA